MTKERRVSAPGVPGNGDDRDVGHEKPEPGSSPDRGVSAHTVSADIVQFALKRLGVSPAVLARRIGVSEGYTDRVLRGEKNFAVQHLEKLAAALEMPLAVVIWQATGHRPKDPDEIEVIQRLDELIRSAYPEHSALSSGERAQQAPPVDPPRIPGRPE